MVEFENMAQFMSAVMKRFDSIDRQLEASRYEKECLDGDKLLDNQNLCEILRVTKRTLARYRQKKKISYYMIDGRTYYKASEVKNFLIRKGKPADTNPTGSEKDDQIPTDHGNS